MRKLPARSGRRAVLLATVLLAAGGCAAFNRLPQEEGLNPRLTPTTYLEEGKIVAFAVDTNPATHRVDEAFLPFPVSIANLGLERLRLDRESFTLRDESGASYPLASVPEIRERGSAINGDYRMGQGFFEVVATSYEPLIYQPMTTFPVLSVDEWTRGRGVLREKVELGRRMWTTDMLYFPRPKGPVKGKKFELWMRSPDLPDPIFVKLRVK